LRQCAIETRSVVLPQDMRELGALPNRNLRQPALDFSVHAADFNSLQHPEKERAMNKSSPVSFAPLAALLLAGSALAQTIPSPDPSGVDASRADRHCISTTLATDASAPCSGDVLNDRPGEVPLVLRSTPGSSTPGTVTTSTGTQSNTGTASTTSNAGAMGTGATSATGATGARR
jgi:hypothetical protein